ncbi:MAG: ferrous iron transport protein B [Bacteroidota bacterium]|nr:ferrous iron transport protein B [Bacteroidota bacterium]
MTQRQLRVALLGNPNTGKSSIFNALTGLRQKTGNFAGVTVEKNVGLCNLPNGNQADIIDLPGTYSLFPQSPDEAVPYRLLYDHNSPEYPDVILFIADATNLYRNMVLFTQAADLGIPIILCLNMMDHADKVGIIIDANKLSQSLGVPIIKTNARKSVGIAQLKKAFTEILVSSPTKYTQANVMQMAPFNELSKELGYNTEYQAFIALNVENNLRKNEKSVIAECVKEFRKTHKFDLGHLQRDDLLGRHRQIKLLLNGIVSRQPNTSYLRKQERLDRVLTHPIFGYLIFFAVLFVIFQSIFSLAKYPMDGIEASFGLAETYISGLLPQGLLNDLICNGILPGLSGVLVFIPQIALLFFFISLLEDSGYLARVAFLMEKTMRSVGMNGKSVIPLISGVACAVPAIMATRNIENKRTRLITIMVTPLMSCSARLPVYILLIGLAVPDRNWLGLFNIQGLVLMGMYILGFLAALLAAGVFKWILKNTSKQNFIMELPAYRQPRLKNVAITVYQKILGFTQAAKIIVAISIILWTLSTFGPNHLPWQGNISDNTHLKLEDSYAGKLGKAIEPAIRPLGYDWKIGIAIITSFAAREVFVGTMTTLYGLADDENINGKLIDKMRNAKNEVTGQPVYTVATIASLLIFYAFAMQCMSTLAVTYKETRSLKWTLIQLSFMSGLAYLGGLFVYQVFA